MSRVVLIGDSLTEFGNWDLLLKGRRTLNLGIAGETTLGLHSRLNLIKSALISGDRVMLMSGINDILMDGQEVVYNLRRIAEFFRVLALGVEFTIQSLLPVCGDFLEYLQVIKGINKEIEVLARDLGVGFLDVFPFFVDSSDRPIKSYFTDDCVHLSNDGYRVWASRIEDYLA